MIPSLVLWLAMVGQGCIEMPKGNLVCPEAVYYQKDPPMHSCDGNGDCRTAPYIWLKKGAEHVIEIRTKHSAIEPWYFGTSCPAGKRKVTEEIDNGKRAVIECARVTKTLWIDGVRIGTIREVDEPSK